MAGIILDSSKFISPPISTPLSTIAKGSTLYTITQTVVGTSPPQSSAGTNNELVSGASLGLGLGIGLGVAFILLCVALGCFFGRRRSRRRLELAHKKLASISSIKSAAGDALPGKPYSTEKGGSDTPGKMHQTVCEKLGREVYEKDSEQRYEKEGETAPQELSVLAQSPSLTTDV